MPASSSATVIPEPIVPPPPPPPSSTVRAGAEEATPSTFARGALGEERVPKALRCRRVHELKEDAALDGESFVEGPAGASTASMTERRRAYRARDLELRAGRFAESGEVGMRRVKGRGACGEEAGRQPLPSARARQRRRADRHLRRGRGARCATDLPAGAGSPVTIIPALARRPPGAAGAGCRRRPEAGRASPRAAPASHRRSRRGNCRHGQLETAAERGAGDRGDDGLRTGFDALDQPTQAGSAVLAGVPNSLMSAPAEKTPGAAEDHRAGAGSAWARSMAPRIAGAGRERGR